MGANDGAEIADLCRMYILQQIKDRIPNIHFGLYRDDGHVVYKTTKGIHIDTMCKTTTRIFKECWLNITAEFRLHKVDFLDVIFDLTNSSFKPYRKPNDQPMHIHKKSNHPPYILKQIASMVEKRLSSISSSNELFDEAVNDYNIALKNSGYSKILKYKPPQPKTSPPSSYKINPNLTQNSQSYIVDQQQRGNNNPERKAKKPVS